MIDFEALRFARNAERAAFVEKMKAEGWGVASGCMHNDPNACYCACPEGPCEHDWNGKPYEAEGCWSTTCSRCGITSMSHSMRTGL